MPAYLVLYNYTDQAMKNVKQMPDGIEQTHQSIEAMGGKVLACCSLMGQYDAMGLYEFPSDEVAMAFLLGMGATGNVRTTTLKAFPYDFDRFSELVSRLP